MRVAGSCKNCREALCIFHPSLKRTQLSLPRHHAHVTVVQYGHWGVDLSTARATSSQARPITANIALVHAAPSVTFSCM